MSPRTLYRRIAAAEVVTWALLLFGMFLKYVTRTTDLAVTVFGLAHGVVFIAFCLVTLLLWVNQRWTLREGVLGLLSAVPPCLTLWWEHRLERRGRLEGGWRLLRGGDTIQAQQHLSAVGERGHLGKAQFRLRVAPLTGGDKERRLGQAYRVVGPAYNLREEATCLLWCGHGVFIRVWL